MVPVTENAVPYAEGSLWEESDAGSFICCLVTPGFSIMNTGAVLSISMVLEMLPEFLPELSEAIAEIS